MYKKYILFLFLPIFLSGCGNLKSVPTTHGQSFLIDSEKNEFEYWLNTDTLLQDAFKKHDFLAEDSNSISFFEPAQEDWNNSTKEAIENNILTNHTIRGEVYQLVGTSYASPDDNIPEEFSIVKEGKTLFNAPMCFGAEGPIVELGYIENKLTFTFAAGNCQSTNVYLDGKTINEQYGVEGSAFPFFYQGKLGFIAKEDGKDYVYFNGQKVSESFYTIPTHQCCMSISPLLALYENGAFVFRASQGTEYYLVEIDLNKYL